MKRMIATLLTVAMLLGSMGTVFALETGVTKTVYTVVVSESFEDSANLLPLYCDGNQMTMDSGSYSFSLANTTIFGMGSKVLKPGKGQINTGAVETFNTASNGAPNQYVETEIDIKTSDNPSTFEFIRFVRDNNDYNQDHDVAYLYANKSTGKFQLVGQNEYAADGNADSNKARDTVDLTVPYEPGETYRIKIVMHLTDKDGSPAREISAVYINGVNALPVPFYLHYKSATYSSMRLYDANRHMYDNFAIYKYTSADGIYTT